MEYTIRKCTREDVGILAETIRGSFRDVAERFGLTEQNCPRHPSNCRTDWVEKDMDRGSRRTMSSRAAGAWREASPSNG